MILQRLHLQVLQHTTSLIYFCLQTKNFLHFLRERQARLLGVPIQFLQPRSHAGKSRARKDAYMNGLSIFLDVGHVSL
jgi:hypothetical protein